MWTGAEDQGDVKGPGEIDPKRGHIRFIGSIRTDARPNNLLFDMFL
jgi:hypothetical protein